MLRVLLLFIPLCVIACDKPANNPAPEEDKSAQSNEGPAQTPTQPPGTDPSPPPSDAPKPTRECKADADCTQTRRALEGDTLCCRECGREAVNKSSYDAFSQWCDAQGKDCPDMQCNWAPLGPPVCDDGTCKLGALAPAPPPKVSRACTVDADCKRTTRKFDGPDICCGGCGGQAVNGASLEAFAAWCDARPEKPSCPRYRCEKGERSPVACVDGTCEFDRSQ